MPNLTAKTLPYNALSLTHSSILSSSTEVSPVIKNENLATNDLSTGKSLTEDVRERLLSPPKLAEHFSKLFQSGKLADGIIELESPENEDLVTKKLRETEENFLQFFEEEFHVPIKKMILSLMVDCSLSPGWINVFSSPDDLHSFFSSLDKKEIKTIYAFLLIKNFYQKFFPNLRFEKNSFLSDVLLKSEYICQSITELSIHLISLVSKNYNLSAFETYNVPQHVAIRVPLSNGKEVFFNNGIFLLPPGQFLKDPDNNPVTKFYPTQQTGISPSHIFLGSLNNIGNRGTNIPTDSLLFYSAGITLNQKTLTIQYSLAFYYFQRKNYKAALEIVNQAILLNHSYYHLYLLKAEIYIAQNRFHLAKSILEDSIRMRPKQNRVYYTLGLIYQSENNMDTAYKYFLLAIKTNSQCDKLSHSQLSESYHFCAEYLMNTDKEKAYYYYALSICFYPHNGSLSTKLENDDLFWTHKLPSLSKATIDTKTNIQDLKTAVQELSSVTSEQIGQIINLIHNEPDNLTYLTLLIHIKFLQAKFDQLPLLAARIFIFTPNSPDANWAMARYYLKNGNIELSEQFFKKALENSYLLSSENHRHQLQFEYALFLSKNPSQFIQSMKIFENLLEKGFQNIELYKRYAKILFDKRRVEKAIIILERGINLFPSDTELRQELVEIYLYQKDYPSVLENVNKNRHWCYKKEITKAMVLLIQGFEEESQELFENTILENEYSASEDPDFYYFQARYFFLKDNFQKAEKLCQRALSLHRGFKSAKVLMAKIYFKTGFPDSAFLIMNDIPFHNPEIRSFLEEHYLSQYS